VSSSFTQAREFVYRSGRVLERRLFERLFEEGGSEGVVAGVVGYRNADGGFGNGLEPDKLAPQSQPLDVEFALRTLSRAGVKERDLGIAACDFLEPLADERGFVPVVLPSIADYPRAAHWADGNFQPGINPSAGIAGYLHELGVEHAWLTRVTESCIELIEREPPAEAHEIHTAVAFAERAPGGDALLPRLAAALPKAQWFKSDPADEGYGLPPTRFPREWFDDALYEAHLDRLEADQQEDGGWTIAWEPPGPASVAAWRAIVTIDALRTLRENGR
jgi:hypothetical protein